MLSSSNDDDDSVCWREEEEEEDDDLCLWPTKFREEEVKDESDEEEDVVKPLTEETEMLAMARAAAVVQNLIVEINEFQCSRSQLLLLFCVCGRQSLSEDRTDAFVTSNCLPRNFHPPCQSSTKKRGN